MLSITDGKEVDWANMPLPKVAYGNALDSDFTLKLFHEMRPQLRLSSKLYDGLLKKVLVTFSRMERQGLHICRKELEEAKQFSRRNLDKYLHSLEELLQGTELEGKETNFNSGKQLAEVLFGVFDLPCHDFTSTGLPSTKEDTLQKILKKTRGIKKHEEGRKFILKMLEYKAAEKIHKTYINGIEKAIEYNQEDRVYSSYNIGEVVTGRLSCSRYNAGKDAPKGVSFHTLPRWVPGSNLPNIRSIIKPDPGKVFIAADFSQAEVRMLAQCSRDKNLIQAFNDDTDLHVFSASLIFQKDPSEVTSEERQIAKSVTFLIIYGGGPYKLQMDTGLSRKYCESVFKKYKDAFPQVFKWIDSVHEFVKNKKVAVSLFGRIRHLDNVDSHIKKNIMRALRQGTNFVIQSSTSDIMLFAIQRLQDRIDESGLDAQLLATVHDSVELQCLPEDTYKVLSIVKETLSSVEDIEKLFGMDFLVPFEVDVEVGTSFGVLEEVEYLGNTAIETDAVNDMIEKCRALQA
jgi:DNA polymerase-1